MKPKILIAYATYGSGHKMAAEYIYDYFSKHGNYEIKMIDIMDYGNLIARINKKTHNHNSFSNKIIFSFIYEIFNNKIAMSPYKEIIRILFKSNLKKEIIDFKPDYLISSHFFSSILMGMINQKEKTNTKIITILTDYSSHAIWLKNHKREDAIIVSNEIVKQELIKYGVDKNKIYPFGIPLANNFKNVFDKNIIKKKYNVNNNKLSFLFLSGASGANYNFKYLKAIIKKNLDINIIFVAGKNSKLENKCKEYIEKKNIKNIKIIGFTHDISNLLNIADVVITKPGGLSLTEAIEMKTPMILIPGVGGQENHNAKFIKKNKFGILVHNPRQLGICTKKLVKQKKIINKMHNNLNKYDENKGIESLFNLIKKMEKENENNMC